MSQLLDHIDYLAKEIGARPAGTEEEQQAALYIADQIQHEAGFHAEIEEFTSSSNLEGARAIPAAIVLIVVVLAMIFNVLTVPALILALAATAIYVLEALGKPIISKGLSRGASQNVVAKYQPDGQSDSRDRRSGRRKIVLVAHYDTSRVKPPVLDKLESFGLPLGLIVMGGMAASTFLLLIRIFVGSAGGVATIVLNVLSIIALIPVLLPLAKAILYRMAPYNEGANNNASGSAALIEIARLISSGSVSEADLAAYEEYTDEVVVHGEEAARESGLVPEGVELRYEQDAQPQEDDFEEYTEEERLLAAKAAIAALTGRPVDSRVYAHEDDQVRSRSPYESMVESVAGENAEASLDGSLVEASDLTADAVAQDGAIAPAAVVDAAAGAAAVASPVSSIAPVQDPSETGGFLNAPSWFVAAQKNAKKSETEVTQAQRSRYNQAIETAEREAALRERQREEQEKQRRQLESLEREQAARAAIAETLQGATPTPEGEAGAVQDPAVSPEFQPVNWTDDASSSYVDVPVISDATPVELEPEPAAELANQPVQPVAEADAQPADSQPEAEPAADPAAKPVATVQADPSLTTAYVPLVFDSEELAELRASAEQPAASEAPAEAGSQLEINLPVVETPAPQQEPAPAATPVPENTNPSRSGLFRKLRTDVPSLSGVIRLQNEGKDVSQIPARANRPLDTALPAVQADGSRPGQVDYDMDIHALSAAPEQAFVGEATPRQHDRSLDQAIAESERAVEEALGSASAPASDAAAAPEPAKGQVEMPSMPSSRAGGFLGRLRGGKEHDLEETPQEWLDVDADFDARSVGRERGSWESFRDESASQSGRHGKRASQQGQQDTQGKSDWQGGGFSRVHLDYVDTRSGENATSDTPDELVESDEDRILNEEIGQIIHFRNPQFDNEVWFVAIGSDTELHDGARAFVEEHRSELRGAMIIEVESLGAGILSVASEEGQFVKTKASSRVKRFTRRAIDATGIVLDEVPLNGTDSITTTMQREGYQAMHIFGAEDGKPALKGSADDVAENVDELILEENLNFLLELLK